MKFLEGENTIKRARGTKVKVLFQGLHMTHVIMCWFITYNFVFWNTQFNITC